MNNYNDVKKVINDAKDAVILYQYKKNNAKK